MKQEDQLKHLFEMARQEPAETSVNDVKKWIGLGTFAIALATLLSQLKIGLTKSIIMYTSIASVVGIGITALVFSSSKSDETATQAAPIKQTTTNTVISESEKEPESENTPLVESVQLMEIEEFITDFPLFPSTLPLIEFPIPLQNFNLPLIEHPIPLRNFNLNLVEPNLLVDLTSKHDTKQLNPFTEVSTAGLFTLVLIQGDEHSYRAEGDYKEEDLIIAWETKNSNRLIISYNSKKEVITNKKRKNVKVVDDTNADNLMLYLTFKSLEKLTLGGITTVRADQKINVKDMHLSINGASKIDLPIEATKMKVNATGITVANLNLSTADLEVTADGASKVKFLKPLNLGATKVKLTGGAKMEMNASMQSLDLRMDAATNLDLNGQTESLKLSMYGASVLKTSNFTANSVKGIVGGASEGNFKANGMSELEISGSSKLDLVVNMTELQSKIQGASTLKLIGSIDRVNLDITGSSKFDAKNMEVSSAKVMISGASTLLMTVLKQIVIDASGSSSAKIYGNPTDFKENTVGAAKIQKM